MENEFNEFLKNELKDKIIQFLDGGTVEELIEINNDAIAERLEFLYEPYPIILDLPYKKFHPLFSSRLQIKASLANSSWKTMVKI